MSESVVALIPNVMLKAGFMGITSKPHVLVFTEQRIIFARVTSDMIRQASQAAKDGAAAEGKGFLGKLSAQMSAYTDLAKRYETMPPEQILHDNPDNFAVDRSTVKKAKIKAGAMDAEGGNMADRLIITTTGKKYTVVLNSGTASAKKALAASGMA